jgi:UTP--glucose-1-phosphate uridylyltransferase
MKIIRKAIISCAGFGTRFLPISKTIQKEMLPIMNRPVIDYVIDDCIKAGIQQFIIIMNEHNYQPLHYYRENIRLKEYLDSMNKSKAYSTVEDLHTKAQFTFVKQSKTDPYGTSIPVLLAQEHIK